MRDIVETSESDRIERQFRSTCVEHMNETRLFFGSNTIYRLRSELKRLKATNVLLVYGKKSAKEIKVYDKIIKILNQNSIRYKSLSYVESNPKCYSIRDGAGLCKQNNIDLILAIGGGSAIDCAKMISAAACVDMDPWDIVLNSDCISKTLPVGSVLTKPSIGAESSNIAYITNSRTREKKCVCNELLRPEFSIIDPNYTITLPEDMTKYHIAALLAQIMEMYLYDSKYNTFIQYRMAETFY